jgi:hypothetical protein
MLAANKRHLFAFSSRLRMRRDVGHEALRADPGVDLEVRRAHDVLFFLRLRVVEERLVALFELERPLVGFLPLARADPRLEPRFVWRALRFEREGVSESPLSSGCVPGLAAPSAV